MEQIVRCDLLNESLLINRLSNGLNCYIIPKAAYVEKQAVICVNYGSVDNQFTVDGQMTDMPPGMAHFLEHKLFEDEHTSIFDDFVALGANVNAFTNFTNTAYYFNCIDNFDSNLALLLDFTSTPYFTDENVEKEKGIIAQEINMYTDNPYWQMSLNLLGAMYTSCPVRYNIAGEVKDIMRVGKDMLYHCFETFYHPENMALICVGDFDKDQIYRIAEEHMRPKQPKAVARVYGQEPVHVQTQRVEAHMSLSRPMFSIGFKDSSFDSLIGQRIIDTKILMDILAGESSDFFNRLYVDGKLDGPFAMEFISSSFYASSVFSAASNDPDAVLALLIQEIEMLKQQGINHNRFTQIRNKHMGRFARNFNAIDAIATSQVDLFSKGLTFIDLMNAYENVNIDGLTDRLHKLFRTDNVVLSVMRPKA